MRKRSVWMKATAAAFILVALIGLTIIAESAAGTSSDPLVTLSYINGTYKSELLESVNATVSAGQSQLANTLASQITSFKSTLSKKTEISVSNPYQVVTLTEGKSHEVTTGAEILMLSGTVSVDCAVLTDTTACAQVAGMGALLENHLYIGSGKCQLVASGSAKFLIKQ